MVTLVPTSFFNPAAARETLAEVAGIAETDKVKYISLPQYDAVLIYNISETEDENSLPEIFYLLRDVGKCPEYNKILASWKNGTLDLVIVEGSNLMLANSFRAADFTTAQYYVFLAMKSLQLNPEISTISWNSELDPEDELSLYRYFKSVDYICG